MRIIIDTEEQVLINEGPEFVQKLPLYSKEAFEIISRHWVRVGWDQKNSYAYSWMGRPIIQLPDDMIRTQEVVYKIKPDVIIETGIAHGGSLIYSASLCKLLGKGRVIGIDIEIRKHNRKAIEEHELFPFITLIEGSSVDEKIVSGVKSLVSSTESVLVILDSCHTKDHVRKELEAYCPLVSRGSYIVATDGISKDLYDVPGGKKEWIWDNPMDAAKEFAANHPEFILEQPSWPFNESKLNEKNIITHWPGAWLRRI
jgi:cephalosporin hydroxylase